LKSLFQFAIAISLFSFKARNQKDDVQNPALRVK